MAAAGKAGCGAQPLQLVAELLQPLMQAGAFGFAVASLEMANGDARLVQHRLADGEAGVQRLALQMMAAHTIDAECLAQRHDLRCMQEFGQHHGDDFQRLALFGGVVAGFAVLHHQHAHHCAPAQHRHPKEGMIDFLPRFRQIAIGGVTLGLCQAQGFGSGGNDADQSLAHAQAHPVHRLFAQALAGEQFQRVFVHQHIKGAHFRHHVGGDELHDAIEFLLGRFLLRHDIAQPAEQEARAMAGHRHGVAPSLPTGMVTTDFRHIAWVAGRGSMFRLRPRARGNGKEVPES